MKTRFIPPNLSNATPPGIVDMCGEAQEELNRLKKLADFYKAALKARLSKEYEVDPTTHMVKGEKYNAVIAQESQNRFSIEMAMEKGYLTEEQYAECFRTIPMTVIRFEKLEELQQPQLQQQPSPEEGGVKKR